MRRIWIPLCGLLLAPAWMLAQQPQQPAVDPNNVKMEEVLGKWEAAMTGMSSVLTDCKRITVKKAFKGAVDEYSGEARMLKSTFPNQPCRASLAMFKKDREQDVYDKIICTGTHVFIFDPMNKTIKYANQPAPGTGAIGESNFLDFLFGMKAGQAKDRYKITYVPPPKGDTWYYYLKIVPRTDQDRTVFKEARVALKTDSFLPRQLWFLRANDDEETWDFPHMIPNSPDVRPQNFVTPDTPKGWQMKPMKGDK